MRSLNKYPSRKLALSPAMAPSIAAIKVKSIRMTPEPAKIPIAVIATEPGIMVPITASDSQKEIKNVINNAQFEWVCNQMVRG